MLFTMDPTFRTVLPLLFFLACFFCGMVSCMFLPKTVVKVRHRSTQTNVTLSPSNVASPTEKAKMLAEERLCRRIQDPWASFMGMAPVSSTLMAPKECLKQPKHSGFKLPLPYELYHQIFYHCSDCKSQWSMRRCCRLFYDNLPDPKNLGHFMSKRKACYDQLQKHVDTLSYNEGQLLLGPNKPFMLPCDGLEMDASLLGAIIGLVVAAPSFFRPDTEIFAYMPDGKSTLNRVTRWVKGNDGVTRSKTDPRMTLMPLRKKLAELEANDNASFNTCRLPFAKLLTDMKTRALQASDVDPFVYETFWSTPYPSALFMDANSCLWSYAKGYKVPCPSVPTDASSKDDVLMSFQDIEDVLLFFSSEKVAECLKGTQTNTTHLP